MLPCTVRNCPKATLALRVCLNNPTKCSHSSCFNGAWEKLNHLPEAAHLTNLQGSLGT